MKKKDCNEGLCFKQFSAQLAELVKDFLYTTNIYLIARLFDLVAKSEYYKSPEFNLLVFDSKAQHITYLKSLAVRFHVLATYTLLGLSKVFFFHESKVIPDFNLGDFDHFDLFIPKCSSHLLQLISHTYKQT
ncbi:hypothetical protein J3Q64DRAFT_1699842 [Phycomyces blakesleeanus]|uniref:Uncharacterized protein n=1 Tax=Phycomyces blakesleeanus TaxID=4837 RepID=A0ABR3AXN1_PHYBL